MAVLDETGLAELWAILKRRFNLVADDVAEISVTVKTSGGLKVPGVTVTGVFDESGAEVVTDSNGVATGYVSGGETTIGVSGYADIADVSDTSSYTKGSQYTKTLTVTPRNFLKVTSSKSLKFSGNVSRVDVTAVGGGGGGGRTGSRTGSYSVDYYYTGGGGGGGYCTVKEAVTFAANTPYSAVVGAGGAVDANGGASSFLGVSANGGSRGQNWYSDGNVPSQGGAGNGAGGNGAHYTDEVGVASTGTAGKAGSVAGYSSFTETVVYGGGGGGGLMASATNGCSGAGYGADGAYCNQGTAYNASPGADGFGGGGGASAMNMTYASKTKPSATASRGGSGCIAIRMHLKVA